VLLGITLKRAGRMGATNATVLEVVASEVRTCTRCNLWRTRKNAVPGEGDPNTKVMLIGEAPGYWEDVKGRPFVGAAGKFLDMLLAEAGLLREKVFIGNVLKCRPPGNREPTLAEIEACAPFLERQIGAIKPKLIVTLGNCSTAYIFGKAGIPFRSIMEARGKFYQANVLGLAVVVFPTLHPAAGLYSARYKQLLIGDFRLLKAKIMNLRLTV